MRRPHRRARRAAACLALAAPALALAGCGTADQGAAPRSAASSSVDWGSLLSPPSPLEPDEVPTASPLARVDAESTRISVVTTQYQGRPLACAVSDAPGTQDAPGLDCDWQSWHGSGSSPGPSPSPGSTPSSTPPR